MRLTTPAARLSTAAGPTAGGDDNVPGGPKTAEGQGVDRRLSTIEGGAAKWGSKRRAGTKGRPGRLLLVAVLAVVAFLASLTRFADARFLACSMKARADPAYSARLFIPPSLTPQSRRLFLARQSQGVTVRVAVRHDGSDVTPARVCLVAVPVGKPSLGVSDEAHEVGPGQYDLLLGFDPPGPWSARVVVVEPGRPGVAIPVRFTVPFPAPGTPSPGGP
jgi:hypothetical protein